MYNFAFITDESFYLPTYVAIVSLLEHLNNAVATIYCIERNLSKEQIINLRNLGRKGITIKVIDSDKITNNMEMKLEEQYCSANRTALIKFDLADILSDVDLVLYLDGDIVIKGDILEIFFCDITNAYAAAVADSGIIYNKTIKNIFNGKFYFNSGVMLLNLDKIRREKVRESLYYEKSSSNDKSLMDQNVFNKIFADKVVPLPLKYNCQYVNIIRAKHWHDLQLDKLNELYHSMYNNWNEIEQEASVLHFASFDKPWKYSDVTNCNIWDEYYCKSGFCLKDLKRKKLHSNLLYKLSKYKLMKYPVNFIWECEVSGIKRAMYDFKRFLKKETNSQK